jgi:quinolinate synthase
VSDESYFPLFKSQVLHYVYFQMNSLRSLLKVCHQVPDERGVLSAFQAGRFNLYTPLGRSVADVGCEPILHMRHFQVS